MIRIRSTSLALLLVSVALVRTAAAQEPQAAPAAGTPEVVVTPAPTPPEQSEAAKKAAHEPQPLPSRPAVAAFVKGEGFRLLSPDGNWKLRVGFQGAAAYAPTFVESGGVWTHNWSNFRVPYARLLIEGNLVRKWIRYWFSFEFASFPPFLLDGYVEAQPWTSFGVRLGQMYTPISSHEYLGPQQLLFPDWAITADYFWTGRDKGIQLWGETKFIDYYAGFYAGTPLRQTTAIPGHFQLMGRVTVHPLGPMGWGEIPYAMAEGHVPFRFQFSVQGYWGKITPSSDGFNPSNGFYQRKDLTEREQAAFAADFWLQWGRFFFETEYYLRHIEPIGVPTLPYWQDGLWAQAHFTFFRRILDAAVRFNWIRPSDKLASDDFFAGEAQLAWFVMAPYLTLKLRYAYAHQEDPGPAPADDPMLFNTVQLPLTPGNGHLLTLQASISF